MDYKDKNYSKNFIKQKILHKFTQFLLCMPNMTGNVMSEKINNFIEK
jgi:hypothetical protein